MNILWLYLGIILACSGIGTGFGIFLISTAQLMTHLKKITNKTATVKILQRK